MPSFIRSPKEFFAGLLFILISAVFAYGTRELQIGTPFRMGPGYFPMVLCILLAGLGFIILGKGVAVEGESITNFAWRGLLYIILPLCFFGATLRGLGFVLSLGISIFVVSLASAHFRLKTALLNIVVLVFLGWLIFIWGLGLPIRVLGSWLGGH